MTIPPAADAPVVRVRRIHRRDLNATWEFLKLTFRDVNRETVEFQRPISKKRFLEVYEEEGIEQLLFETTHEGGDEIIGYAECALEIVGNDNWMNQRYFSRRDMRPLFVEELAVHPEYGGKGVGSFILEQIEHMARLRGCTHLVLEVAENNENALKFYKKRSFYKLDAAIFMAKKLQTDSDLLPPRPMGKRSHSVDEPKVASVRPPPRARATKLVKPIAQPTDVTPSPKPAGRRTPKRSL